MPLGRGGVHTIILVIMNVHCRYAALKTAEDEDWLYAQKNNEEDLNMYASA
jgi:hypothetical protein